MNPAAEVCETCLEAIRNRGRWLRLAGIQRRHTGIWDWDLLTSAGPTFDRTVAMIREFLNRTDAAFLALIGARGTGKTQLGCVATYQAIARGREARRRHVVDVIADLKGRFGEDGDTERQWRSYWVEPWLLVLDEFQAQAASDYSSVALNRMLDQRYEECRATILIANCRDEAEFGELVGDRIADRCNEAGGVLVCNWPSFRGREAGLTE